MQTAKLMRRARPELSGLQLDEIKRNALRSGPERSFRMPAVAGLRRRILAMTIFVMLFAISTSNAATRALNAVTGGSLGNNLGMSSKSVGLTILFGAYHFGGDKSDDAGHETYCKDDKGSDDNDASSNDHSDEKSDDGDASSGDKSDGDSKSDDGDASSNDHSDEKSDDGDASSGDQSDENNGGGDCDEKSDDGDASSGDHSDY